MMSRIHLSLPNAYKLICFDRNINGNRDVKFLETYFTSKNFLYLSTYYIKCLIVGHIFKRSILNVYQEPDCISRNYVDNKFSCYVVAKFMALNGGKSARYTAVLIFYTQAQGLVKRLLPSRIEESTIMYGEGRKKYFLLCVVENYR